MQNAFHRLPGADGIVAGAHSVCGWSQGTSLDCTGFAPRWLHYRSKARKDRGFGFAPSRIREVAVGREDACALLADRSLLCWGDRYGYELPGKTRGRHAEHHATVIDFVEGLDKASQVAGGFRHMCAIADGGKGGGLIICSSNSLHPGVKPENCIAMFKATKKYGSYAT